MTESEWLASDDPVAMMLQQAVAGYRHPRSGVLARDGERKLRLFAVACCRQPEVWERLVDDAPCPQCKDVFDRTQGGSPPPRPPELCQCQGTGRINRWRRAVEVAERFADGEATEEELDRAREDARTLHDRREEEAVWYASAAAFMSCHDGHLSDCANWTSSWARQATAARREIHGSNIQDATQAALLRCVFGNPFRRQRLCGQQWGKDPGPCYKCEAIIAWNSGTIPKLAQRIDRERRCEDVGQLADALEEAGCADETILRHLRGYERCHKCLGTLRNDLGAGYGWVPCMFCVGGWIKLRGPHARGCWVIDLLTGRE